MDRISSFLGENFPQGCNFKNYIGTLFRGNKISTNFDKKDLLITIGALAGCLLLLNFAIKHCQKKPQQIPQIKKIEFGALEATSQEYGINNLELSITIPEDTVYETVQITGKKGSIYHSLTGFYIPNAPKKIFLCGGEFNLKDKAPLPTSEKKSPDSKFLFNFSMTEKSHGEMPSYREVILRPITKLEEAKNDPIDRLPENCSYLYYIEEDSKN